MERDQFQQNKNNKNMKPKIINKKQPHRMIKYINNNTSKAINNR